VLVETILATGAKGSIPTSFPSYNSLHSLLRSFNVHFIRSETLLSITCPILLYLFSHLHSFFLHNIHPSLPFPIYAFPFHCLLSFLYCATFKVIFLHFLKSNKRGPGSSVGIATDNGLDGPGSNAGGDEIFRPSRPALGPTQLPVKWVPGVSRG